MILIIMYKSRLLIISVFVFVASTVAHPEIQAADSESKSSVPLVIFSAGEIGIDPDDDLENPNIVGIDYRMLPFSKWNLIPLVGFVYKDGGERYAYVDLRYDYWLSNDWILVPSYGVGLFDREDELDLGGTLEFRAGLEISHRFENDYRLGLSIWHLSNGRIYDENPGTEAVVVTLSIPLHD